MPKMEASSLKRHLETGELYPVYFLFGEEKYLLRRGVQRLAKRASAVVFPEFNLGEFSAEAGVDAIADAALALPFMAERKWVFVSDFQFEGKQQVEQQKLLELLESPSESTVLVFTYPTLTIDFKKSAKWRALLKAVEAVGASVEYPRPERGDVLRLLVAETEKRGSRITRPNAERILEYTGSDLLNLVNELEKLCAYAKDREITQEDIEQLVTKSMETTVFVLSKAIIAGDYARAYTLLGALFYAGEKAVPILSVLATTFVDMYRVRAALQSGKNNLAPAAYGDYKGREFRLKYAERDVRSLSTEALRRCLDLLLHTDFLLKSAKLDEKIILEELLAKLLVITKGGATL